MKKLLISLFDISGVWSVPYLRNGYHVIRIDIKDGIDLMKWNYRLIDMKRYSEVRILIAQPCTCYALSGNRHKKARMKNGEFDAAQKLVKRVEKIVSYFNSTGKLKTWALENPATDIHTHNKWLGLPVLKFNPCDFAGYSKDIESNRYNKQTWIFGSFIVPAKKRVEPIYKENPGWKKLGGKSERTKELRSVTPDGFAEAFYKFNHA
jgi:hypothetical protein